MDHPEPLAEIPRRGEGDRLPSGGDELPELCRICEPQQPDGSDRNTGVEGHEPTAALGGPGQTELGQQRRDERRPSDQTEAGRRQAIPGPELGEQREHPPR